VVRNRTIQSFFTILVDPIFTIRIQLAFTKAFDAIPRMCTPACLWRTRHAD
jgi:hypothetical protein